MGSQGLILDIELQREGFDLSFQSTIPTRGVTALYGPSGSGKTTLLRCIAGLEKTAKGTISLDGRLLQQGAEFLEPHRRQVGIVFQDSRLFPHLTVLENLRYGWRRNPDSSSEFSPESVGERLGLKALFQRRPDQISGGQQRRVALARTLLSGPGILLLDEPLSGLDEASRNEILPYLDQVIRFLDIPVLYVTHDTAEVARFADRIALVHNGRLTAQGPVAEVLCDLSLPLAKRSQAESVIKGQVSGFDRDFELSNVAFPGGEFTVAEKLEVGSEVRLKVFARDVSLATEDLQGSSILNRFPAIITEMADLGPAQVLIKLDAGGTPLLSRVTRKSASTLGLRNGKEVVAQVKSVAVVGL